MKLSEFDFELPEELIAQHPVEKRDTSRLMVVNRENGNIEHHRMIDVLRRETKFGDIETVADRAGEVREEYTGLQEILNMALEKLPPVQKTVILLRDYEAYSYGEIAGITGLNESQVKVYIFRARAFMKAYIRRPDVVV